MGNSPSIEDFSIGGLPDSTLTISPDFAAICVINDETIAQKFIVDFSRVNFDQTEYPDCDAVIELPHNWMEKFLNIDPTVK